MRIIWVVIVVCISVSLFSCFEPPETEWRWVTVFTGAGNKTGTNREVLTGRFIKGDGNIELWQEWGERSDSKKHIFFLSEELREYVLIGFTDTYYGGFRLERREFKTEHGTLYVKLQSNK